MLLIDPAKASTGHYLGLADWLNDNVGEAEIDYWFNVGPRAGSPDSYRVTAVRFADSKKETIALLRWV